jgi:hypothetical protein
MIKDKIRQRKAFKNLPKAYQLLSLWERWIKYDMTTTGNIETQQEYLDVCIFINRYLEHNKFEMKYLPQVKASNSLESWFKVKREWDKDSLKAFNLTDKFDIVVRGNNYVFRNLTQTKK